MSGEDQERFEDYLELEHYIEELQAGRVAHPPAELTPSQASIYRMAALFRSATPEASEPRPEFAAELQARLEQELQQSSQQPPQAEPPSFLRRMQQIVGGQGQRKAKKPDRVSRRALLTGGAAVAASLATGVGIGYELEKASTPQLKAVLPTSSDKLIGDGVATVWHLVTPQAQLGDGAVRFATDSIVGYVIRDDSDDGDASD